MRDLGSQVVIAGGNKLAAQPFLNAIKSGNLQVVTRISAQIAGPLCPLDGVEAGLSGDHIDGRVDIVDASS